MIRVFSFLYRHSQSGILYFRYTIPERYRPMFGVREVKRSLKTSDKAIALPLAMRIYCQLQEQIKWIEGGMSKSKKQMTVDMLAELDAMGGSKSKKRCVQYITTKVTTPDGQVHESTFDTGNDDKDYELSQKMQASLTSNQPVKQQPQPTQEKTETLAKVAKLYRKEKVTEKSWRSKTHNEHEAVLDYTAPATDRLSHELV